MYSDVIEWLESVRVLKEIAEDASAEYERIMSIATGTTSELDGMPHGTGKTDKVGNGAVKLAALADQQIEIIVQCETRRNEVINVLRRLPAKEYRALYNCYILFKTDAEIADEMDRSSVQVWRYKQNGIKRIKNLIKCENVIK